MELTDKELAVRWWGRRSIKELREISELTDKELDNIDSDGKEYFWRKQQSF